ncbi:hypothetical protein LF1_19530 [Rubripirellula obstinata]|uniref:Competence protein A n=1 Tax=Rubripirellula obstinata TaxID=406547 RepID=A0A5B1CGT4_9BACT|nr:hypothetical protein [Rubripirellula obstinata]KAA1259421.1 hypothetical protein LF1_19530 [Rubripirellula obstinata]
MNKIAIDWDENELRLVVGDVRVGKAKITDAAVLPLEVDGIKRDVSTVLREAIAERGLENCEAMIAIGRGKAELRELQLPPVPDEELPDMVRFQAVRTFASSGESSIIDYLVTQRSDTGIELIAAAMGPKDLAQVQKVCKAAVVEPKRIALRPISAATLYLTQRKTNPDANVVLVDLLGDDAEIVIARDGHVIFVRTVRIPASEPSRGRALIGELKRSLVACGDDAKPDKVILWGKESVHQSDRELLSGVCEANVDVIDPFDLANTDRKLIDSLPKHVGRLAPLVGLLVAEASHPELLVDFLNPRKRPEVKPNHVRTGLLVAIPALAALFLGYIVYSKLSSLDQRIAELKEANNQLQKPVDEALKSIGRTEQVDQFLDGNVQWLDEFRRLAERMPGSDEMIVRSINASADQRSGGGKFVVSGGAISPDSIDQFESSLRDDFHTVIGDGASEEKTNDAYRWGFTETIQIDAERIRNQRYERILAALNAETSNPETGDSDSSESQDAQEVQP